MILLTGSTGFIGRRLTERLDAEGVPWCALPRELLARVAADRIAPEDAAALFEACRAGEVLIHCAGYAHAFAEADAEVAERHHQVNFLLPRHLAQAAARAGVQRFVFLSSVKAMGEPGALTVDESFAALPLTPYGQAKRAAEQAVLAACEESAMQAVNLRLSMVYGAGGRGNLNRMAGKIAGGWFPPLPETGNRRSLVHVDDVVSAIRRAAHHPRAAGQTYIVAGPEAPSGRVLYQALRCALGLPPSTWAVPAGLLRLAGKAGDVLGRVLPMPVNGAVVGRLLDSACYAARRIETELGWTAQVSLEAGLREMLERK